MPTKEEKIETLGSIVARRKAAYKKVLADKGASDPQARKARKLLKRAQRRRLKTKLGRRISAKQRKREA